MPHTSHRKKVQHSKRATLLDDDGWTRVTTTSPTQREPRSVSVRDALERREDTYTTEYHLSKPYEGATLEKLVQRYRGIEKTWLASDSWSRLENVLRSKIGQDELRNIDRCVVFGTGSYCGHIGGWIERFDVSLYQLAAFKAVVDAIESITGHRPPSFSQEPVYNNLDIQLLTSLGIEKIDDPEGFKSLTPHSLIYAPAAELSVELRALAANPTVAMVTGKLDFYWRNDRGEACTDRILVPPIEGYKAEIEESIPIHELKESDARRERNRDDIEEGLSVLEEFKKDQDVYHVPELDVKDQPFHALYVYARKPVDGDRDGV